MKANLFALFCITLFVLSVPQAFAQGTDTNVPANQTVEENPTENPVTEPVEAVEAAEADSVQEKQSDVELVPKAEEPAAVESNGTEEVAPGEPEVPATTEAQEKEETADKVEIVVPVNGTESGPETAPVTTEIAPEAEQDSTEEVAADKSDEVVAAPSGEGNTTTTAAEPNETIETVGTVGTTESPESTESPETTAAAPTETPGSTNATNATNAEPSAPVSSPEASQETAPAAEESPETAPAAESEEQLEKKDGLSLFGLISKVLVGLGILSVVILVGCVYHYRYQMQKYKIAPFTPPSFLPECLFPRNTESSGRLISGYTELQVGNYQSAPRFAEI